MTIFNKLETLPDTGAARKSGADTEADDREKLDGVELAKRAAAILGLDPVAAAKIAAAQLTR